VSPCGHWRLPAARAAWAKTEHVGQSAALAARGGKRVLILDAGVLGLANVDIIFA